MSLVTDALSKSRKNQLLAKANRRESYLKQKSAKTSTPATRSTDGAVRQKATTATTPSEVKTGRSATTTKTPASGADCHVQLRRPRTPTERTNIPQTNLRRFVAVSDSGATMTFALPQRSSTQTRRRSGRSRRKRFNHFLIHLLAASAFMVGAMALAFYAFTDRQTARPMADTTPFASPGSDSDRTAVEQAPRRQTESSAPLSLRQSIQRLDIRGIQIAPYAAKAIINDRIVHQGDRFSCGETAITFKGIQDSNLIFQDDRGEIYTRPLRYHARTSPAGDDF